MAFRPFRPIQATASEVNLTPLIDVSLVLVVMLLLATPLAFESSIKVNGGEATGRRAETSSEQARIELVVVDAERVRVNELDVRIADLGRILEPLFEDAPGAPVVVRCESGVNHGTFVAVLDEAKAHGAASIAVTRGTSRS